MKLERNRKNIDAESDEVKTIKGGEFRKRLLRRGDERAQKGRFQALKWRALCRESCTVENYLLPILDKNLLRKRFIIETLFDKLKSGMGLEHTRHRSPTNAFVHILSCAADYVLAQPKVKWEKCRPRRCSEHSKRNISLYGTRV